MKADDIIDQLLALNLLNLAAVVMFEGDGPDHYDTCKFLLGKLYHLGGRLVKVNTHSIKQIGTHSKIINGKYIAMLD